MFGKFKPTHLINQIQHIEPEVLLNKLQTEKYDPNQCDGYDYTLLMHLVRRRGLLTKQINMATDSQWLQKQSGYPKKLQAFDQCIQQVLEDGADVNFKPATGEERKTALMVAVEQNDLEMIHLLLDKGADLHIKDREGMTALNYAEQCKNTEAIAILKTRLSLRKDF